jgi:Conjugative transposon protein TraO
MKKFLISCIALSVSSFAFSQQKSSSLSLIGGITEKKGLGFMVNYTYSSNNSNYEFAALHSLFKDQSIESTTIDYSTTTLNVGYLHTVLRNTNNSIALNLGGGVTGGYESISTPEKIVLTSKSGFIVGLYGVIQTDFYLSDNFSLLFRAQENFMFISTTGKLNPYISAGIKFNL